jgi:hypothetical protein
LAVAISVHSQTGEFDAKHPPRFEDFPISENWSQPPAPLKLNTRSERMFKTQLMNAVKDVPNFAGHYRIAMWGCGSNCGAGAVIDLQTGSVFPPPLGAHGEGWSRWMMAPAFFDGSGVEYRRDSRLVVVKGGINYSKLLNANVPDTYYFVWEGDRFRQILHISATQPSSR